MSIQHQIISAADFNKLLEVGRGVYHPSTHTVVTGNLVIDARELPGVSSLNVSEVTFQKSVRITEFKEVNKNISLNFCNVQGDLLLDENHVRHVEISRCSATTLQLQKCSVGHIIRLNEVKVEETLDIFSTKIVDKNNGILYVYGVKYRNLVLDSACGFFERNGIPFLQTDDAHLALQFHLLGIPTLVPSDTAESMLRGNVLVARSYIPMQV